MKAQREQLLDRISSSNVRFDQLQWLNNLQLNITNCPDPIEEVYDMYLGEDDTPRIVELIDNQMDLDSELGDRLADPYLELYH